MTGLREHWRALRWSAWLGWQIESNWTEPWLFLVYVVIKPLTGSLLLVCMYFAARTASPGGVSPEFLPFLYVGNACYGLVGAVGAGMSYTVISDRDHYGMLKYVYISPVPLPTYFVGRGLSRAAEALVGGLINLGLGIALFPGVRAAFLREPVAWGWLGLYLVLGTAMLLALGMILTAAVLNMARHGMFLAEGVAGALYLLCGAVFPLGALPVWLQAAGLALPPTYWMEGMRQALLGKSGLPSPLESWDHPRLALALAVSTAVLTAIAIVTYRWSVRRAWRLGRIDETTGM
jgi:ABC-2 type transport system permease protein